MRIRTYIHTYIQRVHVRGATWGRGERGGLRARGPPLQIRGGRPLTHPFIHPSVPPVRGACALGKNHRGTGGGRTAAGLTGFKGRAGGGGDGGGGFRARLSNSTHVHLSRASVFLIRNSVRLVPSRQRSRRHHRPPSVRSSVTRSLSSSAHSVSFPAASARHNQ